MDTSNAACEPRCEVPAEEVRAWLEKWDLANTNAARLLGVTVRTIQNWSAHGAIRPGGLYLRALMVTNASPYRLAQQLGIELSAYRRSQFERSRVAVADAVDSVPEKSTYRWPAREQ